MKYILIAVSLAFLAGCSESNPEPSYMKVDWEDAYYYGTKPEFIYRRLLKVSEVAESMSEEYETPKSRGTMYEYYGWASYQQEREMPFYKQYVKVAPLNDGERERLEKALFDAEFDLQSVLLDYMVQINISLGSPTLIK